MTKEPPMLPYAATCISLGAFGFSVLLDLPLLTDRLAINELQLALGPLCSGITMLIGSSLCHHLCRRFQLSSVFSFTSIALALSFLILLQSQYWWQFVTSFSLVGLFLGLAMVCIRSYPSQLSHNASTRWYRYNDGLFIFGGMVGFIVTELTSPWQRMMLFLIALITSALVTYLSATNAVPQATYVRSLQRIDYFLLQAGFIHAIPFYLFHYLIYWAPLWLSTISHVIHSYPLPCFIVGHGLGLTCYQRIHPTILFMLPHIAVASFILIWFYLPSSNALLLGFFILGFCQAHILPRLLDTVTRYNRQHQLNQTEQIGYIVRIATYASLSAPLVFAAPAYLLSNYASTAVFLFCYVIFSSARLPEPR